MFAILFVIFYFLSPPNMDEDKISVENLSQEEKFELLEEIYQQQIDAEEVEQEDNLIFSKE